MQETRSTGPMGNEHMDRLRQIAKQQIHWLGRFIMPFLAATLITSLLILIRQYLMVFLPDVPIPRWLMALGAIIALESVYAIGVHLRLRTPMSLRLLEFVLVMGLVYGFLRWDGYGQGYRFLSTALWNDHMTLLPLLVAAAAWFLARGYGQTFVWLGDIARDVGDQGAATFSWETESLLSDYQVSRDRARAMSYFTRRFLFYASAICVSSAIVIESFPHRLQDLQGWNVATNLATIGFLLSGMLLQTSVYLYRLQVIWEEVGVRANRELPRQWLWSSLSFVALVLLIAALVPATLSPFSVTRTMETLATWIGTGLDFTLPGREAVGQSGYSPSRERLGPMENVNPSWLVGLFYLAVSFIWALLIAGIVIGVLGLVLFMFFQEEWERLHGMLRVPIYVYLWVKETVLQVLRLCRVSVRRGKALLQRLPQMRSTGDTNSSGEKEQLRGPPPSAPALYIRHLFALLIETFSRHGIGPRQSETPLEYSVSMGNRLSEAQAEVRLLTEYYLQARYSAHDFPQGIKPVVRALWDTIVASFHAWLDGEEAGPNEADEKK